MNGTLLSSLICLTLKCFQRTGSDVGVAAAGSSPGSAVAESSSEAEDVLLPASGPTQGFIAVSSGAAEGSVCGAFGMPKGGVSTTSSAWHMEHACCRLPVHGIATRHIPILLVIHCCSSLKCCFAPQGTASWRQLTCTGSCHQPCRASTV